MVDALYAAYEGGYLSTMQDGTLAPASALTRGEAAVFFARVIEKK
ncbi:MAG: S-layer homology domain-containing protein [Clostridia bacterium]|nr:S-layer homology domain-containing protein [Clostridia bacterium]